jgi:hypothetical protein
MSSSVSPALQKVIDEVKVDILSKTYVNDNAIKRKEISRTFICAYRCSSLIDAVGIYIIPSRYRDR